MYQLLLEKMLSPPGLFGCFDYVISKDDMRVGFKEEPLLEYDFTP